MNRSRFVFFLLSLGLLVPIVSATLLGAVPTGEEREDSLYKYLSVFSEVLSLVRRAYVDETAIETLFAGAMHGTTDALDPLSAYVPATAAPNFRQTLEIGPRRSGLVVAKERGFAFVVAAAPGSPAEAAGLRTGDLLASLDEISTRTMPLWQIRTVLAGPQGTEIAIEYLRRGRPLQTTLLLGDYPSPEPAVERREGAAVLRLPHLAGDSGEEVRRLLEQLRESGDSSLILDLRASAGGEAAAAYAVADLFVDSGRLGQLLGADGVVETFEASRSALWSGRLLVLTHRGTQGASEILASVLQQSAGAELVGQRTFGHAGRQVLVPMSSGAQVYLTDAFYTGPDGERLDDGVTPAVVVSDGTRTFADADMPLDDMILERALDLIRSGEQPEQKQAA